MSVLKVAIAAALFVLAHSGQQSFGLGAKLGSKLGSNATALSFSAHGRMARLRAARTACQQAVEETQDSTDKLKKLTECVEDLRTMAEATRERRIKSYQAYKSYTSEMVAADGMMKYLQGKHEQEVDNFHRFNASEHKKSAALEAHFHGKSAGSVTDGEDSQSVQGDMRGEINHVRLASEGFQVAAISANVSNVSLSRMTDDGSGNSSDGLSVMATPSRSGLLQASRDTDDAPSHLRGAQSRAAASKQSALVDHVRDAEITVLPEKTMAERLTQAHEDHAPASLAESKGGSEIGETKLGAGVVDTSDDVAETQVVPDEPVELEAAAPAQPDVDAENLDAAASLDVSSLSDVSSQEEPPPFDADLDAKAVAEDEEEMDAVDDADEEPSVEQ